MTLLELISYSLFLRTLILLDNAINFIEMSMNEVYENPDVSAFSLAAFGLVLYTLHLANKSSINTNITEVQVETSTSADEKPENVELKSSPSYSSDASDDGDSVDDELSSIDIVNNKIEHLIDDQSKKSSNSSNQSSVFKGVLGLQFSPAKEQELVTPAAQSIVTQKRI